jgi:organic hydroperoxide reductase OsmC/OhrA
MNVRYRTTATATATATGDGRNGHTATEDGLHDVDVRAPKELGGPGGATSPEGFVSASGRRTRRAGRACRAFRWGGAASRR